MVKDFKNELSGDVKTTVRALMMPRLRYLAKCIRFGVIGHSSLASTCIEVLCTSSNSEIIEINKIYKKGINLIEFVYCDIAKDAAKLKDFI